MSTNRFGLATSQVDAKHAEVRAIPGITYREATDTYRIRVKGHDERTARTLDEALEVWREIKSGVRTPAKRRSGARHASVTAYANDFITFDLAHRKPSTRRTYAAYVSAYVDGSPLGRLGIDEVTADDARHYLVWLSRQHGDNTGRPLSFSVVKGVHNLLGAVFSHAAAEGRMPGFRMPPTPKYGAGDVALVQPAEVQPPTDEEVAMLIAALPAERQAALVYTLLRTGMRIGEAAALQWRHLLAPATDVQPWRIRIEGTLDTRTRQVGSPKTRRSLRTIPIDHELADVLGFHRHAGAGPVPIEGFVFTQLNGRPLNINEWREHAWYPLLMRSGVTASRATRGVATMTPHDLRHYWVTTHLAQPGIKIHQVADHIGDSVRMVEQVYRHWLPSDEDDMLAAMAATRRTPLKLVRREA